METQKKTFLDKVTMFIEEKLAPPLVRLSNTAYISALQKAMIVIMPYMILGATATLIINLPGLFGAEGGLNLPVVAAFFTKINERISPVLLQIVFTSNNILTLLTVIGTGYALGEIYKDRGTEKINPLVTAILSLVAFLCFIDFPTLSENFDWPSYILGAPSMLGGVIIALISTEIYTFFVRKDITIKMPENVPPMIAQAFVSLIPASIVVILAAILGAGLPINLLNMLNNAASVLVVGGSSFIAQFIAFLLDRILWFVGLHGSNIVGGVMGPIWTTMIGENVAAFAANQQIPYLFTNQWINAFVRISVFPIALMAARSKVKRLNVLGKLSLPGTIFNIAEPIMFGLPIVLNPLMFIPWVLGFGLTFLINGALVAIGFVPPMVAMTVWTMPAPLAAFIGTGFSFRALIVSLLNFVAIYFIFLPFFRVYEKQELAAEKAMEEKSSKNPVLEVE